MNDLIGLKLWPDYDPDPEITENKFITVDVIYKLRLKEFAPFTGIPLFA